MIRTQDMRRWLHLLIISIATITSAPSPWANTNNNAPPNILLIVLDDFGYNDLGANGNPDTPTPNLDALAAQGIRYTRHYADATCSLARAALLTGQFPAVHGLRPAHLGLSKDTPTIASALGNAGYRTQHIGKWHVANATLEQSPSQLGFDDWFGFLFQSELSGPSKDGINFGRPTYINPWLRENQSPATQYKGHLTDILTERAISFIGEQNEQSIPWFLNLWFYAPHNPIQPADRFKERHPANGAGNYHALIEQLDTSIGLVLKELDRQGMSDNTLVIVLSDNGGTNQHLDNNSPFYGKKTEFQEGGIRTPLLMRWPGKIKPETVTNNMVSIHDIFPTVAQAASATLPEGLIGRDLLGMQIPAPSQLYWETSGLAVHRFSVLSADGRWRYTRGDWWHTTLNDLETDPTGSENVLEHYPEVEKQLTDDFLRWRLTARKVNTTYEELNNQGRAILRGKDMQRSPGNSGFTFAIGVTPDDASDGIQVIAEQASRWRLQSDDKEGVRLDILGHSITAPTLPRGQCTDLVVTSHYQFTPIGKNRNKMIVDVFVNGKRVNGIASDRPIPQNWGYANPTYIGINPHGKESFMGVLSRPLILNERVVPDSEAKISGNGISDVPSMCQSHGST